MARTEINGKFTSQIYKYLKKNSLLFDIRKVASNPIKSDFCKVNLFKKFLISKEGKICNFYDQNIS